MEASGYMHRQRLVNTVATTDSARTLQHRLIDFNEFRQLRARHPLANTLPVLEQWQARRLKNTHLDLYQHADYHSGLAFLLTDLYAPARMTQRDDNIDRIFPKLIQWLPDHLLDTLAGLVDLNHQTQRLDLSLLDTLAELNLDPANLTGADYCRAYRQQGMADERERQIALVGEVGHCLDRYVRSRSLGWLLSVSRGPADMAGLADLHGFLHRGYRAFQSMAGVDALIERVVSRERRVYQRIMANHPAPFDLAQDTADTTLS